DRVRALRQFYARGIAGMQNDSRIAGNFALLAASFYEAARYLADAWPGWKAEALDFIRGELVAVRDEMLGEAREQQESEVFLATLRDLVAHGRVRVEGDRSVDPSSQARVIGKVFGAQLPTRRLVWQVSVAMAAEAVQESLRLQGRPALQVTGNTLVA